MFGFIRVASATPKLKVADCIYNTSEILNVIKKCNTENIKILVFPELSITSYTCGELFAQSLLLEAAEKGLKKILEKTKDIDMLISIGLPAACDNQCFNCSAVINKGKILGIIPKTYLPNYGEFYEKRWFSSSNDLISTEINICGQTVPIGSNLLFNCENIKNLTVGVEICEDLWVPVPPSSYHSMAGATIILNGSASNELVSKPEYRKNLVSQQSARCICGYIYASSGIGESTQDAVFSGHSVIYENGTMLSETERFSTDNVFAYSDIDLEAIANDRKKNTSFMNQQNLSYRKVSFKLDSSKIAKLKRHINPKPFVPENSNTLNQVCSDIFNIQTVGLARRFEHTHSKSLVIGISGGLDSTLALLVCVKACDILNIDRKAVLGITMPGFGTTDRTYNNAIELMKSLGTTIKEISIKESALQHFKDIEHNPEIHDITYENTQARERTQILMDMSNKENGFVVGTGDLSELALGWATYNGDHMSMYGVNAGIPKTLVRVLVNWVANSSFIDKKSASILLDVLDTPVSPELLPPDKRGNINQKTEEIVGPYELHDFFLYYCVRFGFSPSKILYIAENVFKGVYEKETLLKWLKNFYKRFFTQQFKRSCLPDGPKVGTISLSPRGDWKMPTDASNAIWIDEIEKL